MLVLGALGVVFGDIGTSPLYAMQVVFSLDGGIVTPTRANALGVVSTIFWSIMLIVSVKYVRFVLRAHNDGEGGVLSLAFLARRHVRPGGRRYRLVMILGVLGAALFMATPSSPRRSRCCPQSKVSRSARRAFPRG